MRKGTPSCENGESGAKAEKVEASMASRLSQQSSFARDKASLLAAANVPQ